MLAALLGATSTTLQPLSSAGGSSCTGEVLQNESTGTAGIAKKASGGATHLYRVCQPTPLDPLGQPDPSASLPARCITIDASHAYPLSCVVATGRGIADEFHANLVPPLDTCFGGCFDEPNRAHDCPGSESRQSDARGILCLLQRLQFGRRQCTIATNGRRQCHFSSFCTQGGL